MPLQYSVRCKIANPSYFRYFVLCTNQPDRSPDAQILPLVLPLTLQITHTTSPRNPVSQKATRDSHTHIPKTPTQAFRQILHGHSDRSFRLLERGIAHLQARDRHPLAPAELQSILEMEKQVDTPPGRQFLKPRSTLSSRWQTTTHCGVLRGFTVRCSNSGLISQKPRCSDICPGDLKEQPGSAGRRC